LKQYRNRIYNPRGQINPYGHNRPTYESKRKDPPYGSKTERYLEKLVPVEKEKQDLTLELEIEELELKDSEFGTEAKVNDFSLDEQDLEKDLEKEPEAELKEFIEEEDLEIGHA